MKNTLIYITLAITLISCGEKTAENSKYKIQISELNTILEEVEFKMYDFNDYNIDSLKSIKNTAEIKFEKAKGLYPTDKVDAKFEEIMFLFRAKLIKGLKGIEFKQIGISKEYEIIKNQIKNLNDNLIHETYSDEISNKYYNSEKNSLIELDKNIDAYNNLVSSVFEANEGLNHSMDSIIAANE